MQDFFDRFKPKNNNNNDKKKSSSDNNNNNVLGNLLGGISKVGGGSSSFQGQGKSLGGSKKPGKVLPVELSDPGSLGIHIEKRPVTETAIVGSVVPGSQAANAGLQRGDIICFQGSDGQEEILYTIFVELAKSNQRPLCFEIRRIETSITKSAAATTATSDKSSSNLSAEAFARKQAMIAAAEERERKNKIKTKPIKTGFVPKPSNSSISNNTTTSSNDTVELPPTIESQYAVELAKEAERRTIAELGYNPYEVNTSSAGKARNAVTNVTHGSIQNTAESSSGTIPQIAAPIDPTTTTVSSRTAPPTSSVVSSSTTTASLTTASGSTATVEDILPPPPVEFDEIFESIVTTNTDHDAVMNSLSIICKLITNATTKKGTAQDTEKFRKVRLANPKIQAAIVNIHGAIDLLLLMGFELSTEETQKDGSSSASDSILVYPPPNDQQPPYPWIPQAIQRLQNYCS